MSDLLSDAYEHPDPVPRTDPHDKVDFVKRERREPAVEAVNHPAHYGGDTPYEVLKVLRAWGLLGNFCLGNAIKYIARHEKKGSALEDLRKARFYLDWYIGEMEKVFAKAKAADERGGPIVVTEAELREAVKEKRP